MRLSQWNGQFYRFMAAGLFAIAMTCSAFADPVIDNVAAGQVSIQQTPGTTVVNQSSQQAIINWQSFNIGHGESTHFNQPAGGIALNRINPSQGASQIYGSLTATGQIILMNPAGFYFGPSAYVNVGGLMATTANMTDQNFLNGLYQFSKVDGYSGAIVNEGQMIAAQNGLIALLAPGVINNGVIQANLGKVLLASGEAFTVNFAGNDMISFAVDVATSARGVDKDGHALSSGISNTGSLIANGGSIMLSAKSAAGVLDNVINLQGVLQAKSAYQQAGQVIISGDTNAGIVNVAANIDVSGKNAGEAGGKVEITGYNILLDSPTFIDASGDIGGGIVRVGGNYLGQGPLPNANAVVMAPDAVINASAITAGNGGEIILWSDEATKAYGHFYALGGALSGNGGFIETSGKHYLDIAGARADLRAANGTTGMWLLDPRNVIISGAATAGGTFNAGNPNVFTPTVDDSTVLNTDIQTNLATANVTITTGVTGVQNGDITVNAPITWATANTLLLQAAGNIVINSDISAAAGRLSLSAANVANSITTGAGGTINVNSFNLVQGRWTQVNATLPAFNVTNFLTNNGSGVSANVQFIRALSGDGTVGTPYVLTDAYGVQGIGAGTATLGLNYRLANNVDMVGTTAWANGNGWIAIGTGGNPFTGTFDGQNFTISNLTINRPALNDYGMFAYNNGTISHFTLTGGITTALSRSANVVGRNLAAGTVSNVFNYNTMTGVGSNIGGIVGQNDGLITGSGNYGAVNASNGGNMGGIAGFNSVGATVTQSFNYGAITPTNMTGVGGIVGNNDAIVSNVMNFGAIYPGNNSTGGIVGYNSVSGSINYAYNIGYVQIGGGQEFQPIVGFRGGSISNVYWDSDTSPTPNPNVDPSLTTAQMMQEASFAGWDFATIWGINENVSFPYLRTYYPVAPQVLSGLTTAAAGSTVNILVDGSLYTSATVARGGIYYLMLPNGSIAANTSILAYLDGNAVKGNAVNMMPVSQAGISGLNLSANTLTVGSDTTASTFNSVLLQTALGAYVDSDIMYSVSGGVITLGNATTPNLTLITGDLTSFAFNTAFTEFGTSNFIFNGPTSIGLSAINTNGSQTYNGTTTFAGDLALTSGGNITIANTFLPDIQTRNLSLTVPGNITLNFDNLGPLYSSFTLNAANAYFGGTLTTTGNMNLNARWNLSADTNLTSTAGSITANAVGGIAGNLTGPYNLIATAATGTSLSTRVYNVNLADFYGATTLNGYIYTGSDVTFHDAYIGDFSFITSANGSVNFLSTVDGVNNSSFLLLNAQNGTLNVMGNLGGVQPFGLYTSADITNIYGSLNVTDIGVTSSELNLYGGLINSNFNVDFSFVPTTNLMADTVINAGLTFFGDPFSEGLVNIPTIQNDNALTPRSLTINTPGAISINSYGVLNGPLNDVVVTGSAYINIYGTSNSNSLAITADEIALNFTGAQSINTTHDQTYNGIVYMYGNLAGTKSFNSTLGNITLSSNFLRGAATAYNVTMSAGGDISIGGNVGSGVSRFGTLTLNSPGTTTLGGTASVVNMVTDAPGTTVLNGTITTTGTQTYNDTVFLNNNITITSTGAVNFAGIERTVTSPYNLTISSGVNSLTLNGAIGAGVNGRIGNLTLNSTGTTTINGNISATNLTTNAGGTTALNANVATTGAQTFNDAVTLGADVNLTTTTGAVVFQSTLDRDVGAARRLTINAGSGAITFANTVGAGGNGALGAVSLTSSGITTLNNTFNAASLTTDALGSTVLNGANITTSGNMIFNDVVTFATIDKVFTSTAGGITFANDVNVNQNATLTATAISILNGLTGNSNISVVGAGGNANLTVQGAGVQTFNIVGADAGTVTNIGGFLGALDFTTIQNLIGGANGATFIFADNATIGSVNGSSLNTTNTIDFTAFSQSMQILLTNTNDGSVEDMLNNLFANYTNITQVNVNDAFDNTLTAPNGKLSNLYITDARIGYVNDPIYFDGFNYFVAPTGSIVSFIAPYTYDPGTGIYTVNGTSMFMNGFAIYVPPTTTPTPAQVPSVVANVIQQPPTNAAQNNNSPASTTNTATTPTWVLAGTTIDQNLTIVTTNVANDYDAALQKVKVNPYCYSTQ